MRTIGLALAVVTALASALSGRTVATVPRPIPFVARLNGSVSTQTSHVGDLITAVVVSPAVDSGRVLLPQGSALFGTVTKVVSVGVGLIHERAALQMTFNEWQAPDGMVYPLKARLTGVDNAREQVSAAGRITGILAAGGAPGFLLGMWQRPDELLLLRSAVGFAGVSHFIAQRCEFHPLVIAGVYALRLTAVPAPDPEIYFPRGTDLLLSIDKVPAGSPETEDAGPVLATRELAEWASTLPTRTKRPKKDRGADLTNLVFLGSRDKLVQAFLAAGWVEPEELTHHSAGQMYRAMSAQSGYSTAPVSNLLLDDRTADVSFEKSLNTVSRRHHIRIWQQSDYDGSDSWLGAATHDTGVHFGARGFTHEIDPDIDEERSRILDDLGFAGCVESVAFAERPQIAALVRGITNTDGNLAIVRLRDCKAVPSQEEEPPRTGAGRWLARRMILEARYSVLRGNVYYWGYRGGRRVVQYFGRADTPTP